jgi:acetyl esterase/lipase
MPIGYLVSTGLMATFALAAVSRHRPRRSSPFRLSYFFGFVFNWPFVAFFLLVASTALAIAQSGVSSPVFWIGLGSAVLASAGLAVLGRRALGTGMAVERAFGAGLGADWRDDVGAELAARLRRRPSLPRLLFAPISGRHSVERIANIRYGPAGRRNLLDLYRHRSDFSGGPTLIYFHGGAFRFGSKNFGARHLLYRLASQGWVCVSANYRLARFPDPLIDVKKAIAWVRKHGGEYGADPTAVFLAGSSAGGHLALTAALTPNDRVFQPGLRARIPRLPAPSPCTATTRQLGLPTLLTTRLRQDDGATVLRRAWRSGHPRHRRRRTTVRRAATRHVVQPGRLRRAPRHTTRIRSVPLPAFGDRRRCDRGLRRLGQVGATKSLSTHTSYRSRGA